MTPQRIVQGREGLRLVWSDCDVTLNYVALRRACRCSRCTVVEAAKWRLAVDSTVRLLRCAPIGSYGLQLRFSDGHDRGIYPWTYLRELAAQVPGVR